MPVLWVTMTCYTIKVWKIFGAWFSRSDLHVFEWRFITMITEEIVPNLQFRHAGFIWVICLHNNWLATFSWPMLKIVEGLEFLTAMPHFNLQQYLKWKASFAYSEPSNVFLIYNYCFTPDTYRISCPSLPSGFVKDGEEQRGWRADKSSPETFFPQN